MAVRWNFDNTYARLPSMLHSPASPVAFAEPRSVLWNTALAEALGLESSPSKSPQERIDPDLLKGAEPIAQAYSGHQFGYFTQLGDGRALLLGEHMAPNGQRWDVHLKGSGPTRYSRRGDGLAALGPMLREYIVSEAMHFLGIPTTRSLAVIATGEPVYRETQLQGALLIRVASSHVRVGTFQYVAAQGNPDLLKQFTDYVIQRHYPELMEMALPQTETSLLGNLSGNSSVENPYLKFLGAVIDRQARLIAQWMQVGFVHGVMNTDNMTISGQTIDYGPCAFLDRYDPATVFSSIDQKGRYAYQNQPMIAQWNLARFAETLLPLIDSDLEVARAKALTSVQGFTERYQKYWLVGMRAKIGILEAREGDSELIQELLDLMARNHLDFTNTFRDLGRGAEVLALSEWIQKWKFRISSGHGKWAVSSEKMNAVNPAVIPRNSKVEAAIQAAESGDLGPAHELLSALRNPFIETESNREFRASPALQQDYVTYCGT